MARFYGSMKGAAKTEATRTGTPNSGLEAHIRGWRVGVWVGAYVDPETGKDCLIVYRTGGSDSPGQQGERLAVVEEA